MLTKNAFDNDRYLHEQTQAILERVRRFGNKLYLEFGGKMLFDYHAARVLPGYDPNVKMRLLKQLKDQADIILCIFAGDIERRKMRADFGISYDSDALKLIDDIRDWGIDVLAVVITRFDNQPTAKSFRDKLERRGVKVYCHRATKGYPTNVDMIVSSEGYGANAYIETHKPLVVVTGPGPGSGKLATCLSQLYHDHIQGRQAGYAKFETFPIWNLPLKHPANVAYEAATADLRDINLIDPFHMESYQATSVNYNRDVEAFPLLKAIWERILTQDAIYKSPTDMGVNRAGFGIVDDNAVQEAARQEIIRRYFRYACEYAMGLANRETVTRTEMLMQEVGVRPEDRRVVEPARRAAAEAQQTGKGNAGIYCGAAIELPDGAIVTGKNSPLMHAASSVILNAIKQLAEIPDKIHLLSATIMQAIGAFKRDILQRKAESLNLEETLIALSISSTTNPAAQMAMEKLKDLRGAEIHLTHMPAPGDEAGLRRLGVNLTSDPAFATRNLFAT
ncbi:MAG: DUF1846 domain-containing protein [Verrucomicrobia bacterium]|nr:DUF1846 domain-containing protein [Verrucomicrobiota bacterium]MBU1733743.1 DUF1846 domain-containing protein [Verrucomicrobiota bacterium]MBU1855591.1 DUF1846 domain-containing protein [Verrucomicrobiota bacterium]